MSDEPVRVNKKELRKEKEEKRAEEKAKLEAKRSEILYYRTVSFPVYKDDWPRGEVSYGHHKSIKF